MAKTRILVVEDEEDIRELLHYNLQKEGYAVELSASGEDALEKVRTRAYDLVLLDLMLPGVDGLQVCRSIKNSPQSASIPVIMLTAKGEEADVVIGLELGADDYVTKPFSPKVLAARIRSILRRDRAPRDHDQKQVKHGDLAIDPARHRVTVEQQAVELTATEFGVLHFLARKPGWVFTRQQIVDAVKGEDYAVTERAVDVQIVGLRKKLGTCSFYIETVRGIGYRFKD